MEDTGAHAAGLVEIAFVIVVAVTAGLGLMRLRQPPMVGFILAGVLLGPTGFGIIENSENVTSLAEMGVLMLLFFIGMELSLKAFIGSLKPAVKIAGGQLLASMVITLGLMAVSRATFAEAIILGFIIALSSTVVAMKMLDDIGELRSEPGRIAVSVLIAQDLAVVPMLILAESLGGQGPVDWLTIVAKMTVAVGFLAGLLWFLGSRPKLRPAFAAAVENNVEILALGSLAFCFAAASLSGVIGLSPVYGAFVAGLVVGSSTLRGRVIPVVEPIQSVLLVVFFLSIGLLIDLDFILQNWVLVLTASLFVITAKTVFNVLLIRMAGLPHRVAVEAGLSMAQIGEFSFVLAAAAYSSGAIGGDVYRLAIAVTAVTLLASPAWMAVTRRLEGEARFGVRAFRSALQQMLAERGGRLRVVRASDMGLWVVVPLRAVHHVWVSRRRVVRWRRGESETVVESHDATEAVAAIGPIDGEDRHGEAGAPVEGEGARAGV
ncbi:cation:proton antiporter domain-containing protein [Mangrovibrevibacter kandeliae]|uniref:cation:proton antiporter domain-containing protein n=1 Tax=Mangrovibrevibacter kandeliae TaxID=2968473 RepID=UPI0021180079|nr:cation:proton antiporter [Aurantimonas sp. CSK15Z-1]